MKGTLLRDFLLIGCFFATLQSFSQNKYQAPKALVAPTIDGIGTDACWTNAPWYNVDQLWLGVQPTAADFSERFKVSWDANKLYVLGEVTDDMLNDNFADPLATYWEDDTWEIFIDENNSGGNHEKSYNAFAYHVSKALDAVDIGSDGVAHLFNTHVNVKRTANGNVYTWEAAIDVYTDAYVFGAITNPKATLTTGKILGFAMAYCDNDGGPSRQSFMGSEFVPGANKNVAYIDAGVFGDLELVDAVSPAFSQVMVASGITSPSAMTIAPDGRIFVCEQGGNLRVIKNGALLTAPAISVNVNLGNADYSERGLLGVAVDPNFATNNFIYLFYTTSTGGKFIPTGANNRVSRFTLSGDVAVNGSETIILELDGLSTAINHNGGTLHFGLDGKLYIATGENATQSNAQNMDNTHGKILRINPNGSIPADNPFTTGTNQKKMIWAYGLRNPFTFDIQSGTGKLFINDVGQDTWEEINDGTAPGKNFGWPGSEGATSNLDYVTPLLTYRHSETASDTTGCAITGGVFFNPISTNYPSKYLGKYFYTEFCNNWIAVMDPATNKRLEIFGRNVAGSPVAIDVHPDGNLYYLSRGTGAMYKITYSGSPAPDILSQPVSMSVAESQPVTFRVQANGATPLTYLWKRNGVDIPNTNSSTFFIGSVAKADSGLYSVVITNAFGSDTSIGAKLTVTAFNSKPEATISSPATNTMYSGGEVFLITGNGTDTQDGALPASAFTWKVEFHHDTHIHDGIPTTGTKTLNLTVPSTGETATNVFLRIYLYVKDVGGLTDTAFIDLKPRIVSLSFATVPAGLFVTIDGQPIKTPVTIQSVVGIDRNIGVVSPQTAIAKGWKFAQWSNSGNETQVLKTPVSPATYTATFDEAPISNESLLPLMDAYVTSATTFAPDGAMTNYGTVDSTQLVVKSFTEGPNRETYFTFDLAKLTGAPGKIKSAKLKLYSSMTDEDLTVKTIAFNVFESKSEMWNEKTINWNNKPGNNLVSLGTSIITAFPAANYLIDITTYVKAKAISTSKSASIVLVASSNSKNRLFISSKENSANKPELLVEYDIVTGLEDENAFSNSMVLFPNPTSKAATLQISSLQTGNGVLEITTQTSTLVYSETIQVATGRNQFNVSLGNLKAGLYFLSLELNNKKYTEKLIIE